MTELKILDVLSDLLQRYPENEDITVSVCRIFCSTIKSRGNQLDRRDKIREMGVVDFFAKAYCKYVPLGPNSSMANFKECETFLDAFGSGWTYNFQTNSGEILTSPRQEKNQVFALIIATSFSYPNYSRW